MTKNNNFINLVIVALLVVVMLQMCNKRNSVSGTVIVHRDTTWIIKDSTIRSIPQLITHEKNTDSTIIKEYYPDQNYEGLLIQYNTLLQELLSRNVFADSLKIDSIGYVHIKDSVTRNSIVGRSFHYNLKYPRIHDSVTVFPAVRQLYFGGGLSGHVNNIVDEMSLGIMYKSKKDILFGVSGTYNKDNEFGIRLQSFWKIKL